MLILQNSTVGNGRYLIQKYCQIPTFRITDEMGRSSGINIALSKRVCFEARMLVRSLMGTVAFRRQRRSSASKERRRYADRGAERHLSFTEEFVMPEQCGSVTEVLLSVSACSLKFSLLASNTDVVRSRCAFEVSKIKTDSEG